MHARLSMQPCGSIRPTLPDRRLHPMTPNKNAFDLLRLAAAMAVMLSHSFPLSGLTEPYVFGDSLGKLAVGVFFAISGYLVCQSWLRDPSVSRFTRRRALRILPGLLAASLFMTLVVGPLCTTLPLVEYLRHPGTWSFLGNSATLIAGVETLPGVFSAQHSTVVNGSLWTLRYEVLMYVALVLLGLTGGFRVVVPALFLTTAVLLSIWIHLGYAHLAVPLPLAWRIGLEFDALRLCRLGAYFFGAASLYIFREHVPLRWSIAATLTLCTVVAPSPAIQALIMTAMVPYTTLVLALRSPHLTRLNPAHDLSYGVYVYAYPVQQALSGERPASIVNWLVTFAGSTALTCALAAMSWRWIEEPALRHKPVRTLRLPGTSPST